MGRTRPNYNFIDEVNSVITGTIDPSDYDTAINTWMQDAWVDVIEYIESQNSTKIKKYEILVSGNLEDTDTNLVFGSVAAAEEATGLDQLPTGIKNTIKNRDGGNLFVYYSDAIDNIKAFIVRRQFLYKFVGDDAAALSLLKNGGRSALKYYGAAYAEPAESAAHTTSGNNTMDTALTQ